MKTGSENVQGEKIQNVIIGFASSSISYLKELIQHYI